MTAQFLNIKRAVSPSLKKTTVALCAHPSMLSHGHKTPLIDCGDDLLSNTLLLSSSALLSCALLLPTRRTPGHLKSGSPSRIALRAPCRRFVSIVAVKMTTSFSFTWTSGAWSVLRSSSSARAAGMSSFNLYSELATLTESRLPPPSTRVCLNFSHFDIQNRNHDIWLPSKDSQLLLLFVRACSNFAPR